MSEIRSAWGIDIGQAGLKALRLRYAEAAQQVIAVAFDYVPHAKILSQPDANPEELIAQALETFLSRNEINGDAIAISVPGQTALARFIQLPPVEASKVVEIVKYEARQQIPFALEEVIWDYQPLGDGEETSGYLVDAEVGLFAMKREQVQHHLSPYLKRKLEVELVQISPLALYNYFCHEHQGEDSGEDDQYTIVLEMGADNTTLVVTNGKKIWIRNVPLGGNHFTRALTKEMKLTFAKAEHLKCNATKSPDPKAVFQALRPIFNDYAAEIQRSIGYFSSVNRSAKIKRIIGLGNGFKLAGLQKFLQQNLQLEVDRIDGFPKLVGDNVLSAPLFQENLLTFAVPYGLALQGLNVTRIRTSLLPPEIKTTRLIRKKKPWAVAAAATLLLGLSTSTMGYSHVWKTVGVDRWKESEEQVSRVNTKRSGLKQSYDGAITNNGTIRGEGTSLLSSLEGRDHWLEVYKAINECLPRDTGEQVAEEDITKKNRIRLYGITTEKMDDLNLWFESLPPQSKLSMREDDRNTPPKGPGYVFTLAGVHYHSHPTVNIDERKELFVSNTLLKNLKSWEWHHIDTAQPVPVRKLGITHPTITSSVQEMVPIASPNQPGGMGAGAPGPGPTPAVPGPRGLGRVRPGGPGPVPMGNNPNAADVRMVEQTRFIVQFVWVETPAAARPQTDPILSVPVLGPDGNPLPPGTVPTDPAAMPPGGAVPPGGVAPPGGVIPPAGSPAVPPGTALPPPAAAPGSPMPAVPGMP